MDPIFSQDAPITPPEVPGYPEAGPAGSTLPAAWTRDRIGALGALSPEDNSAALIWLALHMPAACDAVLDALEDDQEDEARPEPEPCCATCGGERPPAEGRVLADLTEAGAHRFARLSPRPSRSGHGRRLSQRGPLSRLVQLRPRR